MSQEIRSDLKSTSKLYQEYYIPPKFPTCRDQTLSSPFDQRPAQVSNPCFVRQQLNANAYGAGSRFAKALPTCSENASVYTSAPSGHPSPTHSSESAEFFPSVMNVNLSMRMDIGRFMCQQNTGEYDFYPDYDDSWLQTSSQGAPNMYTTSVKTEKDETYHAKCYSTNDRLSFQWEDHQQHSPSYDAYYQQPPRCFELYENEEFTMKENSFKANVCHVCGKSYARPSTLRTHLRTHSGERPYRCNQCHKSFSQAANLTAHLRVHSGEKPFKCLICERRFSQSSSVTTHMRTHSGEKPYVCYICYKAFADSSTLTKHHRIHSGERPYQCGLCSLRFSQSGNLNRHMKVHAE